MYFEYIVKFSILLYCGIDTSAYDFCVLGYNLRCTNNSVAIDLATSFYNCIVINYCPCRNYTSFSDFRITVYYCHWFYYRTTTDGCRG